MTLTLHYVRLAAEKVIAAVAVMNDYQLDFRVLVDKLIELRSEVDRHHATSGASVFNTELHPQPAPRFRYTVPSLVSTIIGPVKLSRLASGASPVISAEKAIVGRRLPCGSPPSR
jgi:hypothetical protein